METKRLKKLTIHKLSEFPVIRVKEQMILKGGYSVEQMEEMMSNGTWTGGQVDGLGYVGSEVTVYGDGDAYWDKEGKYDVQGCAACAYGGAYNSSYEKPLHDITNIWTHRLFHRQAYYRYK